jgi:hypothetical protein
MSFKRHFFALMRKNIILKVSLLVSHVLAVHLRGALFSFGFVFCAG